ncbi:MAG: hypothetical protein ACUVYA_15010 [Planctomycetota bacterium]
MRRARRQSFWSGISGCAVLSASALAALRLGGAEFHVEPVFETAVRPGADVDSVAVWRDDRRPERSLLFVTAKAHDRIEIYEAATGLPHDPPFLGGAPNSEEPGQFDRPNAVAVLYDVPLAGGFRDILLTTEQYNSRIQVFGLPDLSYLGAFGAGEIARGHGLATYEDGSSFYVFVADSRAASDAKIKKYRLSEARGEIGAELVRAFGEREGPGLLYGGVESILADAALDRLHVCGDEAPGRPEVIVYDLAGYYTGVNYGDPEFEYDQEGIALYETDPGQGYLIIADQYDPREPTEFEVFDRSTLASLGHFESPVGGRLVTHHTDGVCLCQMPLPGFPNGAFYAVDYDTNVHAYDWTDIAEAMGLEIVALARPFSLGEGPSPDGARRALWYEDGSWWAVLAGTDSSDIYRLEEGTFVRRESAGPGSPERLAVARYEDELLVLASGTPARLYRLRYDPGTRRHRPSGAPVEFEDVRSPRFALGTGADGRAWIAAAETGELRLLASAAGDRGVWGEISTPLGAARPVAPELVSVAGRLACLWAGEESPLASFHAAGDHPDAWSPPEPFGAASPDGAPVVSLSAAEAGGALLAAFALEGGGGAVWARDGAGLWKKLADLPAGASDPALSADGATGGVYLHFLRADAEARRVYVQVARGPYEAFAPPRLAIGWPGVSFAGPISAQDAPAGARDLVVAALGTDRKVRLARYALPSPADITPPITLQHEPDPEAGIALEGAEVTFRIVDDRAGVDRSSLRVSVGGRPVEIRARGVPTNYLVSAPLDAPAGSRAAIRIEAADSSDPPNVMVPFEYAVTVAGEREVPFRRGDSNDDGSLDVSDALHSLRFLFAGEAPPPAPRAECGLDPSPDGLPCASHPPCA